MEYCNGGDLEKLQGLQPFHRFQEPETRVLAKQLIRGFVYMEKKSIHHFDFKPQNVLINFPNAKYQLVSKSQFESMSEALENEKKRWNHMKPIQVKITDFGLSEKVQREDAQSPLSMKGTPFFISPEIFSG